MRAAHPIFLSAAFSVFTLLAPKQLGPLPNEPKPSMGLCWIAPWTCVPFPVGPPPAPCPVPRDPKEPEAPPK